MTDEQIAEMWEYIEHINAQYPRFETPVGRGEWADEQLERCRDRLEDVLRALQRERAGRVRERLVCQRATELRDRIYPRDIFIGCEECESGTCDCDEGVQLIRRLNNALAATAPGEE